jgi:DNA-binding NarL/FixJ family response regulator
MDKLRVVLADDHGLVRAGIRSLLEELPGVSVVGEASDGREAVHLIESEHPDIVFMDIEMPRLNGLEAARQIALLSPRTRLVILSMHANEEYVLRALHFGAAGFMLKEASTTELAAALSAIRQGGTYLSPSISSQLADYLRRTSDPPQSSLDQLTPRQREILQLIAEGNTTRQIAHQLGLSPKTVESHRAQLMDRLDIHDIAGLVRYAIQVGLVSASG